MTEWAVEEEHYRIDEDGDEELEGCSADTIICDWPGETCIYSDDYRWSTADGMYIEIEDEGEIEDD